MNSLNLRYQVTIFGNFDTITPSPEILKFFIDEFYSKNLIPNQFTESEVQFINNEAKTNVATRLRLSDQKNAWDIRFFNDKITLTFLNSNIGLVDMIDKKLFIDEVFNILNSLSKRFPDVYKRIGFVTQYLISNIDKAKTIQSLSPLPELFVNKSLLGSSTSAVARMRISENGVYDEIINMSYDIRNVTQPMMVQNRLSHFDGYILNIDLNSIAENQTYRFTSEKIKSFFEELLKLEENLSTQLLEKFK